jgi:hypothetical protein
MRLHYLAIVLGLSTLGACAKKQPAAQKPVPAATTPSDPQPETATTPGAVTAPTPTTSEAPAPGSRGPVKKGGDPQDGGE